jgi:hypothetical protein
VAERERRPRHAAPTRAQRCDPRLGDGDELADVLDDEEMTGGDLSAT